MGIDEGFGSSEFGIVITQGKDGAGRRLSMLKA